MNRVKLILLNAAMVAGSIAFAQSSSEFYSQPYAERNSGSFGQGTHIFSFKYGLGNISGTGYNNLDRSLKVSHTNIGPLYVQYEYGLAEEIGVVGYASYAHARDVVNRLEPQTYYTNVFSMGIGALYHFNRVVPIARLDCYAGLGLGFRSGSFKTPVDDAGGIRLRRDISDNTGMFFIRAGMRYYILEQLGVHFELSPDKMSVFNTGISLRL
jgi:hypothetical protein